VFDWAGVCLSAFVSCLGRCPHFYARHENRLGKMWDTRNGTLARYRCKTSKYLTKTIGILRDLNWYNASLK